jgi:ribosomal protein S18 acetylase RimI-like enzyme
MWLEFMRYSEDIDPIFALRDGAVTGFEKEYLRPAMQNKNGLVLVALDGKKTVAYSCSQVQEPPSVVTRKKWGLIEHLFVTASYRRRGIGEKMYAEILKWFHAKDIDRVELEVMARNQVAYSFWKKHGFTDYKHMLYRQI